MIENLEPYASGDDVAELETAILERRAPDRVERRLRMAWVFSTRRGEARFPIACGISISVAANDVRIGEAVRVGGEIRLCAPRM